MMRRASRVQVGWGEGKYSFEIGDEADFHRLIAAIEVYDSENAPAPERIVKLIGEGGETIREMWNLPCDVIYLEEGA